MSFKGTSSIIHDVTHQPLLSTLSAIVQTVVRLVNAGHEVSLVSSGVIDIGLKRIELQAIQNGLSGKQVSIARIASCISGGFCALSPSQALAAIGQGHLSALWDNLFSQLAQPIELSTRGDLSDVSHPNLL